MRFGTRRMTKTERAAFVNVSGQKAWVAFRGLLEAAHTLQEARDVVPKSPVKPEAGWALYANLGTFLKKFQIPKKSMPAERVLYGELIRRLEQAGEIPPEQADAIFEALGKDL